MCTDARRPQESARARTSRRAAFYPVARAMRRDVKDAVQKSGESVLRRFSRRYSRLRRQFAKLPVLIRAVVELRIPTEKSSGKIGGAGAVSDPAIRDHDIARFRPIGEHAAQRCAILQQQSIRRVKQRLPLEMPRPSKSTLSESGDGSSVPSPSRDTVIDR